MTLPPGAISVEPVQKRAGRGFLGGQAGAARGQGWEHPGSLAHQGSRAEPLQAKDSTGNASPPRSSTLAYSCSTTSWKPMARGKVPPCCPTSSIRSIDVGGHVGDKHAIREIPDCPKKVSGSSDLPQGQPSLASPNPPKTTAYSYLLCVLHKSIPTKACGC